MNVVEGTAASSAVPSARAPVLEMHGIDKSFPGVHALRDVDLEVGEGEILGLVGENGAGKSTLIKILSGAYTRDRGELVVSGETVEAPDPQSMIRRGVAVIYQEPSLAPHLTVAENIFMGRLPTGRLGIVDWQRLEQDTALISQRLGLDLEPRAVVGRLSVARRQMIEIAKALSRDARIIVLDEPSAVLADSELQGLFGVMRRLAEKGTAFVYISHRLNEVFQITDRVVVMKDGRVVARTATSELSAPQLVRLMVGRELAEERVERRAERGEVALEVEGLQRAGLLHGINLRVHRGEIVGIAGLAGSGRTELLRAIHGADRIDGGQLRVFGRPVSIRSPREAIALGIGLLTEDRKADGLLLEQSVAFNITITRLGAVVRRGVIQPRRERRTVGDFVQRLAIRTPGIRSRVRNLSGGNQQKAIFAKWLHAESRILLIDEPTRGVDVGAKREIWQLLSDLAARGTAIVMVSSELPEILAVSDRVLVMREGRITAELPRGEATEERIMHLATRQEA
ncbi:MAG TPA: sugar ABC transporter ATP-binding protein [Candidatus Limnocylindria bacterium]|nr:sugar ABC transporter ATP-binding protein [Candidatus Limnocylindria bacterium]